MFRGNFEHSINGQGRVSLPSRFRQVLEERYSRKLVLVGLDDHIEAYPEEEYRKKEVQDMSLPQDDPQVLEYLLMQHHNVWEVELDSQGRILVPPKLRQDLDLEKEVVILGLMDRIFIFRPDQYEKSLDKARKRSEENQVLVSKMKNPRDGA